MSCLPFVRVCEWGKGGRVATGEGVRVSGGGGGVGVWWWWCGCGGVGGVAKSQKNLHKAKNF